jgi:chromosome segregation ATPase
LDEQLADADQELAGAQREVLAAQRAVSDLSNAESARYDAINKITRGELDRNERALAELRRQGRLRSEVWGPVFKHVRVGKPLHGAYLEHVVQSTSRMIGYICELQEDASLVGRELECFAVIRSPSAAAAQAVQVPAPLRQRGVVCLAELVTGTPEVINALMEKTSLGRTCVSEREIDQRSVLSTRKGDGMLTNLIMGPKNYSVAFSRYDQHSVTRVAQIRTTANFFNVGVNEDEVQARQKKVIELRSQHAAVSRKRTELDAKRKEVEVQLQEAVTALARIDTGCRKRKTLEQRRAALRKRVGELSEPQSEATKQELATKLKRAAQQLADKVGELRDAWQNCLGGVLERNGLELHKTYSELRKAALQRHLSEREAAMRSLEDAVARSEQLVTEAQRRSAEARRRADAEAPWPEWKRRFTEEIQALSQASIHARIAQIEESVRGMLQDNDVLQRLEETRRRVADLGLRCTQCENALQNMQRDMSKIRDTFLPRLRDVVNAVDRAFSASFSRMRCQGEVKLLDSDENYAKWELRINVSFRAGQDLKPFGETLSGGERSVVTILFLLALQRVTEVPFRVIDEINQAMDAQNERHVFEQIVESARDKAMPCQYFLLTPKLLPGLDFTNVSVFIAFNGQYSIDSRQWQEVLRRLS